MRLYFAAAPLPAVPRMQARRAASRTAYRLLSELAASAGLSAGLTVKRTAEGRPFWPELPSADFSISHTDQMAFCLLAVGAPTERPRVGIDAEPLSLPAEKAHRLSERFLTPKEQQYVAKSEQPVRAFLEVFTAKEAYAKLTGLGLAKTLKIDTVSPLFWENTPLTLRQMTLSDHVVTLCLPASISSNDISFLKN